MGVILQIIGILFLIGSIISGIIAIVNSTSGTMSLILLIIAGGLIRTGRKIK